MKIKARLHPEPARQGRRILSIFLLGFSYTINKRLALHVNYNHTSQSSLGSTPGYSRNSYSAGLTYTY